MDFPNVSKFAFTVKSTNARPPKSLVPELQITAGIKGKFKLNEAASRLLGVRPTDYIAFINNEEQVEQLKAAYTAGDEDATDYINQIGGIENLKVQWGIAKGWVMLDENGLVKMTKKPLTNREAKKLKEEGQVDENGRVIAPDIEAYKGSRLASKTKGAGIGAILEGTDSNSCPELRHGYDEDKHVVYRINETPVVAEVENGNDVTSINVFLIEYSQLEDKIERS